MISRSVPQMPSASARTSTAPSLAGGGGDVFELNGIGLAGLDGERAHARRFSLIVTPPIILT